MKSKTALLLLSVYALPSLALSQTTNLYTEDFGTWTNLNNVPLSAVGWTAAAPNPAANIIYNFGGTSQFFTWPETANRTNAYFTTATSGAGPSGNVALAAIDPATYSNLTFTMACQASAQPTNETVRFAVRVGGQWYASATTLAQPDGTYSDRSLTYQTAATNWLLLSIGSNNAAIAGQPASALVGNITGVGIVCTWSGAQGSWNFSNFRISGVPVDKPPGNIAVGPLGPAGLNLSWEAKASVYLQSCTNLAGSNPWERIVNSVGQSAMTVPATDPQKFFRLATWPAIEKGSDISELTVEEQNGTIYEDSEGNALSEPLTLCRKYGWTVARIRLFVNPPMTEVQVNSLSYAVAQAQRAKAQGMKVLLDIHYTDDWNEPTYRVPAAWTNQTYTQLLTTVSNYTVSVMNTFSGAGARPEYVQIGNEIGSGFLFPFGGPVLFTNGVPGPSLQWSQFINLVKAGISGARAAGPTTKIMIHIPGGPWGGWCTDYFDAFTAACPNYDLVGISYYPSSTGSSTTDLSDITATLNALHNRYPGKKLWIAETSYAWNWGSTNGIYPNTSAGQAAYASALCNLVASYSDGGGVCWWGGFYVANDNFPYNWAAQALFESSWHQLGTNWLAIPNHRALPAVGSFSP